MGHYCRLFGTKNSMHIDYVSRTVTMEATAHACPAPSAGWCPPSSRPFSYAREGANNVLRFAKSEFHYFAGLQELFRRFYASIIDDAPLPISYRDMLRVARMMDDTWAQLAAAEQADGTGADGTGEVAS